MKARFNALGTRWKMLGPCGIREAESSLPLRQITQAQITDLPLKPLLNRLAKPLLRKLQTSRATAWLCVTNA